MDVAVTAIPLIGIIILDSKEAAQFSIKINQVSDESTSFFSPFKGTLLGTLKLYFI